MLIVERPVILLDEPTLGLDYTQRKILIELIQQWQRDNRAVLLATHDQHLVNAVANRIIRLEK